MMTHGKSLFSSEDGCTAYENIRNAKDAESTMMREQWETLWCYYSQCFSKDSSEYFCKEIRYNFDHQHWFEMYLAASYKLAGYNVKHDRQGPDILLTKNDQKIWIEATCPTSGEEGRPDSVPPRESGKRADMPIKQYVMRVCQSLSDKAIKFKKYIDDGTVSKEDILVIAINVGGILGLGKCIDECMKRSLYGEGHFFLLINPESFKVVGSGHETKKTEKKSSGSSIDVQPFLNGSMPHISAVLSSYADEENLASIKDSDWLSRVGSDYDLYLNCKCENPLYEELKEVILLKKKIRLG